MSFALHPQLAKDCIHVCDLHVCRVLLMNNRHFPWLILVPMRENARELFDLSAADYAIVMQEVRHTAQLFSTYAGAHKMNIAALGNMVGQLHIHIIARHTQDVAWPNPVWNALGKYEPYLPDALKTMVKKLQELLR